MIIFLYGQDTYRSTERLNILRGAFIEKFDPRGHSVVVLHGDELKIEDFRKSVFSQGLLSTKRFVVVKNIITEKRTADFYEDLAENLKNKKLTKDVILVFWEGSDLAGKKRGNKLYSVLSRTDKVEEYKPLEAGKLNNWVIQEVKNQKGKISKQAVDYLAANLGPDLWVQKSELDKLTALRNGKLIRLEDVEMFVSLAMNDNIFHFADALSNKNTKQAAKLLDDQLSLGANEFYLLTMLARQFKILLQVKEGLDQGFSSPALQRELKLHPFVIKKSLAQARKFTIEELKKIYQRLLEIDIKLKTSGTSPKVLFDIFIVEVCE